MKKLFSAMLERLEAGENAVLCTILASSGSSPRGAGAKMAVFSDGTTVGTVGGGAVELEAAKQAMKVLASGQADIRGYVLRPDEVVDIGMVCGGSVTVFFRRFTPAEAETVAEILALLRGEENAWLVMRLELGCVSGFGTFDEANGLRFTDGISGEELRPMLRSRAVYTERYYVEPLVRAGTVYIFGGGHVGKALAPVLANVGFRVCIYDEREALAKPENYPGAERVICGKYSEAAQKVQLRRSDYAVIMTPGHQADTILLKQVLQTEISYVGCIGSRKKIERTNAALREAGISEAAIASVHSPIGLPILAETPEEIAISVTAELIRCRAEQK